MCAWWVAVVLVLCVSTYVFACVVLCACAAQMVCVQAFLQALRVSIRTVLDTMARLRVEVVVFSGISCGIYAHAAFQLSKHNAFKKVPSER